VSAQEGLAFDYTVAITICRPESLLAAMTMLQHSRAIAPQLALQDLNDRFQEQRESAGTAISGAEIDDCIYPWPHPSTPTLISGTGRVCGLGTAISQLVAQPNRR
jgi:hypothetical protein